MQGYIQFILFSSVYFASVKVFATFLLCWQSRFTCNASREEQGTVTGVRSSRSHDEAIAIFVSFVAAAIGNAALSVLQVASYFAPNTFMSISSGCLVT